MNFSLNNFMARFFYLFLVTWNISIAQEEKPGTPEPVPDTAAVTPTPEILRAPTPNLEEAQRKLLAAELKDKNIVTLEAEGRQFIGVWEPDHSGNPFGAVILLHDAGQTADWPNTIRSLRGELAHHGWATFAISLPAPVPQAPPARPTPKPTPTPEADEATEADDEISQTEKPTKQEISANAKKQHVKNRTNTPVASVKKPKRNIKKEVNTRLAAAIKHLNSQGHYNIVIIASGLGAGWAVEYTANLLPPRKQGSAIKRVQTKTRQTNAKAVIQRPIRAMIILNPRNVIPDTEQTLPHLLNDPELPILDIVFNTHYLDSAEAKIRKEYAGKNRLKNYYQINLMPPTGNLAPDTNRLVRRVRGFLNKHAKGVEIAK